MTTNAYSLKRPRGRWQSKVSTTSRFITSLCGYAYPTISISPVKGYIEQHAGLKGKEPLQYL